MGWKNLNINTNLIKIDTGRAVLINCPHNSLYKGYSFWHPSKLVRTGRHSTAVSIGYTDDFTFKLKKYGNGKTARYEVSREVEIGVSEFEEMFKTMDMNISKPLPKNPYETHKPQILQATKIDALEDLKDE